MAHVQDHKPEKQLEPLPAPETAPIPEPPPEPLKVGDTVILCGVEGAVLMTVTNVTGSIGNDVTCAWFGTTGAYHEHVFHAAALERPSDKKKRGK